jgi:RHS repeat-associated protein
MVFHQVKCHTLYTSQPVVQPTELPHIAHRENCMTFLRNALWRPIILSLLVVLSNAAVSSAQSSPDPFSLDYPYGTYDYSKYDSIDLATLDVRLDIPLESKPGRGIPTTLHITHTNKLWTSNGSPITNTNGWNISIINTRGYLTYLTKTQACGAGSIQLKYNYIYVDGYGADHLLSPTSGATQRCGAYSSYTATDGSGIVLTTGSGGHLADVNGNTIYANAAPGAPGSTCAYALADENGNYVEKPCSGPVGYTPYVDTLGQTSYYPEGNPLDNCQASPCSSTMTYIDANGQTQTITLNFQHSTYAFGVSPQAVSACTNQPAQSSGMWLLNSIRLPNGTSYNFGYETYSGVDIPYFNGTYTTGRITSLTLPTGGVITYQYPYNGSFCNGPQYNREVTRTTPDGTWDYKLPNGGVGSTVVTDPYGNQSTYTFAVFGDFTTDPSNYTYIATSHAVYNGAASGTPLLLEELCVNGTSRPCASQNVPASAFSTFRDQHTLTLDKYVSYNGNPAARTSYVYNGSIRPSEMDEYDFGGSTPLRRTTTSYLNLNGSLTDKPTNVVVADGGGNTVAQTQYHYDEASIASMSNVPNHFTPTAARGNLTSLLQWSNSNNQWYTTRFAYDDTGNQISTIDPKSNPPTTISFSDSWAGNTVTCPVQGNSNAFPTKLTDALGHLTTHSYDPCTGSLVSTQDPNDIAAGRQGTTYSYDEMGSPLSIQYPDGGSISYNYHSYGLPSTVTATTAASPDPNVIKSAIYDGLGRVIQTQLTSDPSGADYTDTTYDKNGRIYSVSNSYRTTSDPTYGTTYYAYDAIGRPTIQTQPDSSKLQWCYNGVATAGQTNCHSHLGSLTTGTWLDSSDEASNDWQRTSDALGRLTEVVEPNGGSQSPSMETDYQYDALDNLRQIDQWGGPHGSGGDRVRTFSYDSLSRLVTASNPETGSITYAYLASSALCAGNLSLPCSRTAPAPNQTGTATVTTGYTYDALNRLTAKSYSDGTTPQLSFIYDSITGGGPIPNSNEIGRLSTTWSAQTNTGTIFNYDPMGRITNTLDCIDPAACAWNFTASYNYDLVGNTTQTTDNITTWTGPVLTSVTFNQSFDPAGRATRLTSNWVDSQHPATLATVDPAVGYYPNGAIRKLTLGNGLTETAAYNNRSQPCRMNVNSAGAYLTNCSDPAPSGNVLDFTYGYNSGTKDNGNLASWSAVGQQTFSRSYGYDTANRLQSMLAPGSQCSGLSWSIDAWGNRTGQTVTGGTCYSFQNAASQQNRLGSPYQYDAAGNVSYDGTHHYSYDAENRVFLIDGGSTASYVYDPSGRRASKTIGGKTTNYGYDLAGNVVFETQGSNLQTAYIYFGGSLRAQYKNGTTSFLHTDHLGSTRLVTALNQSVLDNIDYQPFGEQVAGGTSTSYKFTSKERDAESNNDYFGARYYSSSMGRFLSPDWSDATDPVPYAELDDPQSLDLYGYAENTPLTNSDWTGHVPCGGTATVYIIVRSDGPSSMSQSPDDCPAGVPPGIVTGISPEAARDRQIISGLQNMVINGKSPHDFAGSATDEQIISAYGKIGDKLWRNFAGKKWYLSAQVVPGLARFQLLRAASDPTLRNIINDLYKDSSSFGDGGTADAIEYERATGRPIGQRYHTQKGEEYSTALRNLINSGRLNPQDKAIATQLLNRLQQALTSTGR